MNAIVHGRHRPRRHVSNARRGSSRRRTRCAERDAIDRLTATRARSTLVESASPSMSFTEAFKAIPQVRAEPTTRDAKRRLRRIDRASSRHPLTLSPASSSPSPGSRPVRDAARQTHAMHATGQAHRGRDLGTRRQGAVRIQGAAHAQKTPSTKRRRARTRGVGGHHVARRSIRRR